MWQLHHFLLLCVYTHNMWQHIIHHFLLLCAYIHNMWQLHHFLFIHIVECASVCTILVAELYLTMSCLYCIYHDCWLYSNSLVHTCMPPCVWLWRWLWWHLYIYPTVVLTHCVLTLINHKRSDSISLNNCGEVNFSMSAYGWLCFRKCELYTCSQYSHAETIYSCMLCISLINTILPS